MGRSDGIGGGRNKMGVGGRKNSEKNTKREIRGNKEDKLMRSTKPELHKPYVNPTRAKDYQPLGRPGALRLRSLPRAFFAGHDNLKILYIIKQLQ